MCGHIDLYRSVNIHLSVNPLQRADIRFMITRRMLDELFYRKPLIVYILNGRREDGDVGTRFQQLFLWHKLKQGKCKLNVM